jgi:glutamyl-tRNA reductase
MSLLIVGVSHHSAPVHVLDRIALSHDESTGLLSDVASSEYVAETMVLSTCNRLEVYADVNRFHGGVAEVSEFISKRSGVPLDELTHYLYVHFEENAAKHLFEVAAGIDSMVVGEAQILGQVRKSLKRAQEAGTAGRNMHALGQASLRIGKRIHTETGIDQAGASVVSVALAAGVDVVGPLEGKKAVIVGAGSMGSLTSAHLRRANIGELVLTSRTDERAQHLAALYGGSAVPLSDLATAIADADIVVSCTGAAGVVIGLSTVQKALKDRGDRPLVMLDLALPHDIDPAVVALENVYRVDLSDIAVKAIELTGIDEVDAARQMLQEELTAFLAVEAAHAVEPVVVSLRARADALIEAEVSRLKLRLPNASDDVIAELTWTLHRTVQSLLHAPTVRVKKLAAEPDGQRYAEALRQLFDLGPEPIDNIFAAEPDSVRGGESA